MNAIIGEAIVSCYLDAAAILLMVLLLLLSERIRERKTASLQIFYRFSYAVALTCVACFAYNAMYRQPAPWCHTAALIARTMREILVLLVILLWIAYVSYKLNGEKEFHTVRHRVFLAPAFVFLILLIVNLFNGMVFTVSAENVMEPKLLYYALFAVDFLYFGSSLVTVRRFDRKATKTRFLSAPMIVVFVVVASVPQFFTRYDIGILWFAVGVVLVYFSMISEIRFVDEESELYNRSYLAYLFDMAIAGKNEVRSALILEADGNLPAVFRVVHEALQYSGDVIRVEESKFLMFSQSESRSTMQYLSSLVEETTEKHNRENPEDTVRMTARCRMRTEDEDAFTFIRTVMEEKEAGDTMRGIVSMMSELDRLDQELKLAADIQINMLPMIFPPFPERTEIDLYASMTAAKEVGGDFYDFFLIDDDHLGLVIADVSGKGIPAALFMMVSKTLIKNQLMSCRDPGEALEHVNVQLCERNSSMMFVTVWLAVLELSTGRCRICNAGHENPAVRRNGGDFELVKYKHDMMVGIRKKAQYLSHEFVMQPGDCLFVYTDGVPEATNEKSEMFKEEGLIRTLNVDADAGAEALIRRVHEAVDRFADGTPQFDDITMLCLKYLGTDK